MPKTSCLGINIIPGEQSQAAMQTFLQIRTRRSPAWYFLSGEGDRYRVVGAYYVRPQPKPSKPGEVLQPRLVFLIDRDGALRVLSTYTAPWARP